MELVTVRVPGLLPGLIVPPEATVTDPTLPEPPRVPVLLTVMAEEEFVPFTVRRPPLMAVVPVRVLSPVRVRAPAPVLAREPAPLRLPAKVLMPVPTERVKVPAALVTEPVPVRPASVWAYPPKFRIAPPDTATVAPLARRLSPPAVRVPEFTFTLVAAAVPARVESPPTLMVPEPRLAEIVPPLRA